MATQTERPVDLRAVTPMVFERGAAVYVDLGNPAELPHVRVTSVRDCLALSEAFIVAAQKLRAIEVAARTAAREGYGDESEPTVFALGHKSPDVRRGN